MPYCSNCGTQNSDTAKFCVNCGAALQNADSEQKTVPSVSASAPGTLLPVIGSKVSFAASDGKTYMGTIKEIQGDQYKIKYDAFDFETWLRGNQFTVVAGNTPPPIYSSAPQSSSPQVTFTNSTSAGTPAFLTHLGFWGSLMIIIGFFTNWLNLGYYGSLTGLKIITSMTEVMGGEQDKQGIGVAMVVAIAIVVISAVICLLYTIGAGIGRGAFSFFKILPLLALIAMVAYIVIKSNEGGNNDEYGEDSSNAWKLLGIGVYLTLAGALVLAVSRSRSK